MNPGMDPPGVWGLGVYTPNWGSSPSFGCLGVKNKPKDEVKIHIFFHKMRIKPKILRLRQAT